MKKNIHSFWLLLTLLFFCSWTHAQIVSENPFYYYSDGKNFLNVDSSRMLIISENEYKIGETISVLGITFSIENSYNVDLSQNRIFDSLYNFISSLQPIVYYSEISTTEDINHDEYMNVLHAIQEYNDVIKVMPFYVFSGKRVGISNNFYVKLFNKRDFEMLNDIAKQYAIQILGSDPYMPLWITLSCGKETPFNALEAARIFYELQLFKYAQPEFLYYDISTSYDEYFSDQWGLKNTGQYDGISGFDIKAEQAWTITTGSNVVVAIFDSGFEMDHPDLENNVYGIGYDVNTASSPAQVRREHGTACAGICAAKQNNTMGISGVAPNAKLMSISYAIASNAKQYATGFNWAWHHGAEVISCSWELGGDGTDEYINEAILSALDSGRNGKGTVIVFAAGNSRENNNTTIIYPANKFPEILVVGAMSPCGERKFGYNGEIPEEKYNEEKAYTTSCDGEPWASCYGPALDVIAPGVFISTTDMQGNAGYNTNKPSNDYLNRDYTKWFDGTSAACPHVAGVAALILSVNPNLTGQEVRNIIECSAQKVGGYNYQTTSGRPNGTWHEEMGYGLVNAHAAVLAARCYTGLPVMYGEITQNTTWNTPVHAVGAITVSSGATLTITSTVKFNSESSITILPGGKLILDGGVLTNACENEMWQGITVQCAYTNGIVEVNGGTIENAVCGIYSTGGGLVRTTDAHFMNNTVSVKIDAVPLLLQGISTTFLNSVFTINDNYFGNPLNFETHIKLSNTYKVTVSGCTFKNEATQKSYQPNYNSGIWSFNAPLTVIGYCPPGSPVNPQTGECLNYKSSVFSGLNIALSASNSGATPKISITDSKFTDNRFGVKIEGVDYSKLLKNSLNLTQDNSYGIYISNSTGYKIEENNFHELSPSNNRTVGLTISNSGTPENEVYKNSFRNLYVGQNFLGENSTQFSQNGNPLTGLQTLCNSFSNSLFRDVFVGYLPGVFAPSPDYSSIRNMQGSMQSPAGNCFSQNLSTQFESKSTYFITYNYGKDACENPVVSGSITKNPTNKASICPSKIIGGGNPTKGDGDIEQYLAQYDEWNLEYENWLKKLLVTEPNSEEYFIILAQVSYYSALKDNYFNSIIVAVMGAESRKQNAEGEDLNRQKEEWIKETLRFLFNYRNHYTDNLSIVETYLAESNYREAFATLARIYEKFELTEEQVNELTGLQIYVLWLQQLDNEGNNIYELSEKELDYLINFVKTNTGRGAVFANIILCELYGICLEDEMIRGLDDKMIRGFGDDIDLRKSVESALSACHNALDKITLVPNPTTGELTINNEQLTINNIEIFDIYGRKHHLITSSSNHQINIAHLPAGIYFVKITTEVGGVVKKIIKN